MGLLQEISNAIGGDKFKQIADGQGNFEKEDSSDQSTLQDWMKKVDPERLKEVFAEATQKIDPQEYSNHVTPDVNGTDPLGTLKAGGLAAIAGILLSHLKQAGAQPTQIPGVQTADPEQMDAEQVAAAARYAQQNHPEAFGKAAAQIGQEKPDFLHSFLGKAGMAIAAAMLAKHFIKVDPRTPK
jgi:hypothetical protein